MHLNNKSIHVFHAKTDVPKINKSEQKEVRSIKKMHWRRVRNKQNRKGLKGESGRHQITDNSELQGHFALVQSCQRVECEHLSEENLLKGP